MPPQKFQVKELHQKMSETIGRIKERHGGGIGWSEVDRDLIPTKYKSFTLIETIELTERVSLSSHPYWQALRDRLGELGSILVRNKGEVPSLPSHSLNPWTHEMHSLENKRKGKGKDPAEDPLWPPCKEIQFRQPINWHFGIKPLALSSYQKFASIYAENSHEFATLEIEGYSPQNLSVPSSQILDFEIIENKEEQCIPIVLKNAHNPMIHIWCGNDKKITINLGQSTKEVLCENKSSFLNIYRSDSVFLLTTAEGPEPLPKIQHRDPYLSLLASPQTDELLIYNPSIRAAAKIQLNLNQKEKEPWLAEKCKEKLLQEIPLHNNNNQFIPFTLNIKGDLYLTNREIPINTTAAYLWAPFASEQGEKIELKFSPEGMKRKGRRLFIDCSSLPGLACAIRHTEKEKLPIIDFFMPKGKLWKTWEVPLPKDEEFCDLLIQEIDQIPYLLLSTAITPSSTNSISQKIYIYGIKPPHFCEKEIFSIDAFISLMLASQST